MCLGGPVLLTLSLPEVDFREDLYEIVVFPLPDFPECADFGDFVLRSPRFERV